MFTLPLRHNAAVSDAPIYLDYNATTPVADEVLEAMLPALRDGWGNPSSDHLFGNRAQQAIERARQQLAELLGCDASELIFTSGGTESNNLALIGCAEAAEARGRTLVTTQIEHPAVEVTCRYLESRGWTVRRAAVDRDGIVDVDQLISLVDPETTLVSVMHANNETGVVQPLAQIRERLRPDVPLHSDASQSIGKLAADVANVVALGVDALTVAGHKLYAPKGVGALYLREGIDCRRTMHGADHELGRRAGTENTPMIVALGAAAELAMREGEQRQQQAGRLRDRYEAALRVAFPDLVIHGEAARRLPNTSFSAIPGCSAVELIAALPQLAIGAGSACHAGDAHISATLRAMQVEPELALATLRVSVGRGTTESQIDQAAAAVIAAALAQRGDSPTG